MVTTLTAGETFRLAVLGQGCDFAPVSAVAYLRGAGSQTIEGVADGSQFLFTIADTASWPAGDYRLEVWGTDDTGAKKVLETGSVTVRASIESMTTGTDLKSDAEKALAAIRAKLAGDISTGVRSYEINGRRLERYAIGELLTLEKYFADRVMREKRRARGLSTLGPRIEMRF